MHDPKALAALDFQTLITLTKVEASDLAAATAMSATQACGLSGYRNDGDYTIGRYLGDVLSSPIMTNNDRILANLAPSALFMGLGSDRVYAARHSTSACWSVSRR
jgi:acyl-CoA dehydrogenase